MKNNLILWGLAILVAFPLKAQTPNPKLDELRCFKSFCLGPLKDCKMEYKYFRNFGGEKLYEATLDEQSKSFFHLPVKHLYLNTYNDTIIGIVFFTDDLEPNRKDKYVHIKKGLDECERVTKTLTALIGNPKAIDFPQEDGVYYRAQWLGSRTVLTLNYMWFGSIREISETAQNFRIELQDLDYQLKKLQKGF